MAAAAVDVERSIAARRALWNKARRAARVMELDPHEWARNVRAEVPHLVEAVGHRDFQHLVRCAWSLR